MCSELVKSTHITQEYHLFIHCFLIWWNEIYSIFLYLYFCKEQLIESYFTVPTVQKKLKSEVNLKIAQWLKHYYNFLAMYNDVLPFDLTQNCT